MPEFEWDEAKAEDNLRKHGVSFALAVQAFRDPLAIQWVDAREAYGEERVILLGLASGLILTVVYAERDERIRIISARKATRYEQDRCYRQEG